MTAHTVRKAWNGGTRETAMAAAIEFRNRAYARLSSFHEAALPTMDPFTIDAPYRHRSEPGWVYLPIDRVVILEETARRIVGESQRILRTDLQQVREEYRMAMNSAADKATEAAGLDEMDKVSMHSSESARKQEAFMACNRLIKIVDDHFDGLEKQL